MASPDENEPAIYSQARTQIPEGRVEFLTSSLYELNFFLYADFGIVDAALTQIRCHHTLSDDPLPDRVQQFDLDLRQVLINFYFDFGHVKREVPLWQTRKHPTCQVTRAFLQSRPDSAWPLDSLA